MNELLSAVARIALEIHPDRIDAVCASLAAGSTDAVAAVKNALGESFSPPLIRAFGRALAKYPLLPNAELAAMFRAASATAILAAGAPSVEWVWTGPATSLVPIRHTAQVLTGLIDESRERLFLVSFVAYHVPTVVEALKQAAARKVRLDILLEPSHEFGGSVTVDSISIMKSSLPFARFYKWKKPPELEGAGASVHAKCAVADAAIAFVTSANLSDAALERNIELGILLRGGLVPRQLDSHLQALITTKHLARI